MDQGMLLQNRDAHRHESRMPGRGCQVEFPVWIVRLALRRPYTFIVMALLIAILGGLSILTTPTDVFPYINIPVAGVIWSYSGMSPDDMAKRVLLISERAMTTTVNSIEHIEATAYKSVGLVTCY